MAKKITWSARAQKERTEILRYWINRNKSNSFSLSLNKLFIEYVELVAIMPELGIATDAKDVRIIIVRDYSVYYRIISTHIEVLSIWDNRRNPAKFKL